MRGDLPGSSSNGGGCRRTRNEPYVGVAKPATAVTSGVRKSSWRRAQKAAGTDEECGCDNAAGRDHVTAAVTVAGDTPTQTARGRVARARRTTPPTSLRGRHVGGAEAKRRMCRQRPLDERSQRVGERPVATRCAEPDAQPSAARAPVQRAPKAPAPHRTSTETTGRRDRAAVSRPMRSTTQPRRSTSSHASARHDAADAAKAVDELRRAVDGVGTPRTLSRGRDGARTAWWRATSTAAAAAGARPRGPAGPRSPRTVRRQG